MTTADLLTAIHAFTQEMADIYNEHSIILFNRLIDTVITKKLTPEKVIIAFRVFCDENKSCLDGKMTSNKLIQTSIIYNAKCFIDVGRILDNESDVDNVLGIWNHLLVISSMLSGREVELIKNERQITTPTPSSSGGLKGSGGSGGGGLGGGDLGGLFSNPLLSMLAGGGDGQIDLTQMMSVGMKLFETANKVMSSEQVQTVMRKVNDSGVIEDVAKTLATSMADGTLFTENGIKKILSPESGIVDKFIALKDDQEMKENFTHLKDNVLNAVLEDGLVNQITGGGKKHHKKKHHN